MLRHTEPIIVYNPHGSLIYYQKRIVSAVYQLLRIFWNLTRNDR